MTKQGKLNFNEASQVLGRSKRTITRYIKKKLLNPEKIRTEKGTEYRFNLAELESLKKPDTTGQATRQNKNADKNNDTLSVNKIIKILEKQLKVKEREIHELHVLLGKSQETIYMLEDKSGGKRPDKNNRTDATPNAIKRIFGRWFKKK